MRTTSDVTDLKVNLSNDLVSASYSSTLTQNLLVLIGIGRIQERENKTTNEPDLIAELYPSELKQIVSDKNHIYRELKKVSQSLMGNDAILIYDDENERFQGLHLIRHTSYENGILTIEFESRLKKHILKLERNYTSLELSILSSFKTNAAFRLYELFKSERGLILSKRKKMGDKNDEVILEYNISELKFLIGLANIASKEARLEIDKMGNNVDWDKVYEKLDSKDKKYDDYSNFRRFVLEIAQEELKEKSNISFEFEPIAKRGRKYTKIKFYTYSNTPTNPKVIDERAEYIKKKFRAIENQGEIPYDLPEFEQLFDLYVGHNGLAAEDIKILLQDANGDKELVKRAIITADEQNNISNYVGWIRRYVQCKGEGYETIGVRDGSKKVNDRLNKVSDKYLNIPENATFQERLWYKKVNDDTYFLFTDYLEKHNITLKEFNIAYSVEERLILYKAIIHKDFDVIQRYGLPI